MTSPLLSRILVDLAKTRIYRQKHPARGGNKIYVRDVHDVPVGSQVHEGPLRGIYYIPDRKLKQDVLSVIKKRHMDAKLAVSKYYASKSSTVFKEGKDKEGNPILATLLSKYMGYDKKPQILPDEEISHLSQDRSGNILYRGVGGKTYDGWLSGDDSNIRPGVYGSGCYTVEAVQNQSSGAYYNWADLKTYLPHIDSDNLIWAKDDIFRYKTYLDNEYGIDNLMKEWKDHIAYGNYKWQAGQELKDLYFEGEPDGAADRIYDEIYNRLESISSLKRVNKFKEMYPNILPDSPESLKASITDQDGKISYTLIKNVLKDMEEKITSASDKSSRIAHSAENELREKYWISAESFSPDEYLDNLSEYGITKEDVQQLPPSSAIDEDQASSLARFYAEKSKNANLHDKMNRDRSVKGGEWKSWREQKEIMNKAPGIISRMILPRNTSIIDIDKLMDAPINPADYGVPEDKQEDFLAAVHGDPGLWAMLLGYDAYRIPMKYIYDHEPEPEAPISDIYEDYDYYYDEKGEPKEDDYYEPPTIEDKYNEALDKIMSNHRLHVDNPYIVVLNRGALKVSDKNYWHR